MSTELARRAAAGDTGPEVARWIAEAMRRHLDGDELDHALRLDRASRLRECNQALKDAAALLAADDGAGLARRRQRSRAEQIVAAAVAVSVCDKLFSGL